jgi:sulfite exporter TauE/SafE
MTSGSIFWLLVLGFGLGLKHATEPDHLAAVSTIVSDRKNVWSSSIIGALWGVGHTLSLLLAGILVIWLRFEISEWTSNLLEFCVALMLIGLGIDALRKLYRGGQLHWHIHEHGGLKHAHPHIHDKAAVHNKAEQTKTHHGLKLGRRPLIIGMVHGLAGSGALMLLILSTVTSRTLGITYILVFGIGSIGGMMAMSMLVGLPFHLTTNRFARLDQFLRFAAAAFSLGFGCFLAYEIGTGTSLFI